MAIKHDHHVYKLFEPREAANVLRTVNIRAGKYGSGIWRRSDRLPRDGGVVVLWGKIAAARQRPHGN